MGQNLLPKPPAPKLNHYLVRVTPNSYLRAREAVPSNGPIGTARVFSSTGAAMNAAHRAGMTAPDLVPVRLVPEEEYLSMVLELQHLRRLHDREHKR